MQVSMTVNGSNVSHDVEPRTLLVHYLREQTGLTGTNIGCDSSSCGACTIHVNGEAVKSCTMLAVQADGQDLTTIEGLADGDTLHPMQQAFHECHALQCGYCTPGILMTLQHLKNQNRDFSEEEIRNALGGHICRCTGYREIIDAAMDVVGAGSCQTED